MDKDNQVEASATRETSGAMAAAREVQRALDLDIRVMDDTSAIAAIIYRHMRAESAGRKSIYDVPEVKEIAAALAAYFGDKWKGGQNLYDAVIDTVESAVPEASEWNKVIVELALPYEALLMDTESRKWIAPEIWRDIGRAVAKIRALATTEPDSPTQPRYPPPSCMKCGVVGVQLANTNMLGIGMPPEWKCGKCLQEESGQPGLGARGPVTHQGETK